MDVRAFEPGDAQQVAALIRRALREVNSADYSPEVIASLCEYFAPDTLCEFMLRRDVLVAVVDGAVVGTASIEEGVVYTVFVHPQYHGRGIGTRLVKEIEGLAMALGHSTIRIPASVTAVGFYTKLGYREIERVQKEDAGINVIMEKSLPMKPGTENEPASP
jgi:GNAT superfamily N-acetyltransferase